MELIVGKRVLAQWAPEIYFYPGTISCIEGENYHIQFDDEDSAIVKVEQIAPMDIKLGSQVFGRFQNGKTYYPGVVDQMSEDKIHIKYDDGDEEWTTISMVRVQR